MIRVLSEEFRTDVNGKKYKYFKLYSPEQKIQEKRKNGYVEVLSRSKYCGYISYAAGYNENQDPDPMYHLNAGDEIEGRIITKNVEPYVSNNELITVCTVPVFCSDDDPIEFEIALEKAIKRAGKMLDIGERLFGEPDKIANVPKDIPDNCLIVKIID